MGIPLSCDSRRSSLVWGTRWRPFGATVAIPVRGAPHMPNSTRVAVTRNGDRVCPTCLVARSPLKRMKGLLGRRSLSRDEGIWLEPASSVHTWFMRFPIDVVFVDKEMRVVRIVEALAPWRFAGKRGARSALELAAGVAARAGLAEGDVLTIG